MEGDLAGSKDTAVVSGREAPHCLPNEGSVVSSPGPYYTFEIACSTDRAAASNGLCSTTPCSASGKFFAFRTIHYPNGTTKPAGYTCVTAQQAAARPGLSLAQVIAAVRRVKLPGGEIGGSPGRGLANLESYFWLKGACGVSGGRV